MTCSQKGIFDNQGNLTKQGYIKLWTLISNQIENFDKQLEKAIQAFEKGPETENQNRSEKDKTGQKLQHWRFPDSYHMGNNNNEGNHPQYQTHHQYDPGYYRSSGYETPDRFHYYKRYKIFSVGSLPAYYSTISSLR